MQLLYANILFLYPLKKQLLILRQLYAVKLGTQRVAFGFERTFALARSRILGRFGNLRLLRLVAAQRKHKQRTEQQRQRAEHRHNGYHRAAADGAFAVSAAASCVRIAA